MSLPGTQIYASDPCCNATVALTKCCGPRDGTVSMRMLSQGLIDPETCGNRAKINVLLADAVLALNATKQLES